MEKSISQKVYSQIQNRNVKMRACGYFLARSIGWLFVAGLFFTLSILFIALTLYYFFHLRPWDTFVKVPSLLIASFPYALLLGSILAIYLASRSYRQSRNMCKHEEWILYLFLFFGSFLLGFSIYSASLIYPVAKILEKNSFYGNLVVSPKSFWSNPKQGTLSGVVLSNDEKKEQFVIKTWDGDKFYVSTQDLRSEELEKIKPKKAIKVLGEKDKKEFTAKNIWRWR